MAVGHEAGRQRVEHGRPAVGRGRERQPRAHVGTLEDAFVVVLKEGGQCALRVGVREGERGGQVVEQRGLQRGGLTGG